MTLKRAVDLVGVDLRDFAVKEMTGIFETENGERKKCLGFLEDNELAKGYAEHRLDPKKTKLMKCSVLTDGNVGFLLNAEPVYFIGVVTAEKAVLDEAVAKLTPLELKLVRKY